MKKEITVTKECTLDIDSKDVVRLFQAAMFGNTKLLLSLLDKGLEVNCQDEEGDTLLHHAARWGHSELVDYLLVRHVSVSIKNKKGRTALLEAYTNNQPNIAKKITRHIAERYSAKLLGQTLQSKKLDQKQENLDNFINECKEHIQKNYLNRDVFSQLLARHNGRAKAVVQALGRCASIKEVKGLIKNQCDLFEKGKASVPIPANLLASRWSLELKNKPSNVIKSSFYKVLKTIPGQKPRFVLLAREQHYLRTTPQLTSNRAQLTSKVC
jgi:hypothetical protein